MQDNGDCLAPALLGNVVAQSFALAPLPGQEVDLHEASELAGQIKLGIDKHRLIATIYYPKELSRNEAQLFTGSLGEILKVTYHSLGLVGPRQGSGQPES